MLRSHRHEVNNLVVIILALCLYLCFFSHSATSPMQYIGNRLPVAEACLASHSSFLTKTHRRVLR